MKTLKIVILHLIGLFVILCLHSLIFLKHHGREHRHFYSNDYDEAAETYVEDTIPLIEFLQDSTYKVVIDSIISIYKVKTGEKISSVSKPYGTIKSMAIHPSGSHLLVMNEYEVNIFDLIKDDLSNIDTSTICADDTETICDNDTTMVLQDDYNDVEVMDVDMIEFSSDGRYLITVDYSESKVELYQWPGLEYLTTEYMGIHRNGFRWESHEGKLVCFYEDDYYIYRTEFPSDSTGEFPSFSEPVCIDSVRLKE